MLANVFVFVRNLFIFKSSLAACDGMGVWV